MARRSFSSASVSTSVFAPALLLAAACFFTSLPVATVHAATEKAEKKSSAKAKKSANSSNRPAKVTLLPNSQESTSERNARLKRECKGRVNAGACAGFTN